MSVRVGLALAALALTAGPARGETYLPCSASGGDRALALTSRPSRCLTLSMSTTTAQSVRLTSLRWSGWGSPRATAHGRWRPFGSTRFSPVTVTVDHKRKEQCGTRTYYSRLTVRAGARTRRVWVAPGCDFIHYQTTFRQAVRDALARLPGRVIAVEGTHCTFGSPGRWSCAATGDREYNERPGVIRTCLYDAHGHFVGEDAHLAPLRCRRLV